jgi:hypothetical protein
MGNALTKWGRGGVNICKAELTIELDASKHAKRGERVAMYAPPASNSCTDCLNDWTADG